MLAAMVKSLRSIWVLAFLAAVAVFSAGVYGVAWRAALNALSERGRTDLTLASDRLTRHLFRYRELAVMLGEHPTLEALLDGQGDPAAALAVLRSMADKSGAQGLMLVDREGRVMAATQPDLVERDVTGGPLRRALNGALGAGNLTQRARSGQTQRLFTFAAPVFTDPGPARGAVISEVDIWLFEQNWPTTATAVFFVNQAGRVMVSNRSELVLTDRFGDEGFPAHTIRRWFGHEVWTLDGGPYLPRQALRLSAGLPVIDLTGEILLDTAPASHTASLQAAMAAAFCLAFGAVLMVLTERRRALSDRLRLEAAANARLEARVAKRTAALSQANDDLRRAQTDLVQAGKLSALGQMSAGISHELNQPLMAIRSFAENGAAFLERGDRDKAGQNLTRISELARRMGRIIKNLRAFARQESEPIGDVDLGQVVDAALEVVAGKLAGVTVSWNRPTVPVLVRGGDVRLQQVVLNLISNAVDAMEGRPVRQVEIALDTDGARARLSVRDTGPGITEPARIFDPFYSTKQVGAAEGMGLGLSISYGLVQSFGGAIRGHNHPDGGAVFTVELDRAGMEKAA
ncbi:ATP-binding protein [uncultured Aliiroseovarius sp.]|uniref:sensor histidine kinase n=2 Tax=Aliiroseovarius TaxID=1658781 RepID=UPI002596E06B|nr:ATP-binding protein [uncultured Aliiroseovarius sp.]